MSEFILTKDNYFSKEAEALYMGSSSFKAWDMLHEGTEVFGNFVQGGCEAREVAKRKGEWEDKDKKAFLIGSYVHAWSEGQEAFQKFIDENYSDIYQKNGKQYSDFIRADKMIDTLKNSKLVDKIRDTEEKEVILTGKIDGVDFKIQVDIPNFKKGYFADLKTTALINKTGFKDGKRTTFIDTYDYRLQFALYAEIIRQNLGMAEGQWIDPYIIVVDKQDVPDHEVIYMGKDFIPEKLEEIKSRLPRIMAVRNGELEPMRCGKCEYCRSTKVLERPISIDEFEERLGLYV